MYPGKWALSGSWVRDGLPRTGRLARNTSSARSHSGLLSGWRRGVGGGGKQNGKRGSWTMWVLLARESVEAIVQNEKTMAQAVRSHNGVKKGIVSGLGCSYEI